MIPQSPKEKEFLNFKEKEEVTQKLKIGYTPDKLAAGYGLNQHTVYKLSYPCIINMHGENESWDTQGADRFKIEFLQIIAGYSEELIYNCDQTNTTIFSTSTSQKVFFYKYKPDR